ncbi:MAG: ABC transporter permease [Lachnospirales bacterium]
MFIGLFYSLEYSPNSTEGAMLLVGLVMWQLCTSALSYFSYVIIDEATMGTLEQIFMTRTSIFKVLLAKAIVSFSFNILKAIALFLVYCVFFQNINIFINLGLNNTYIMIIIVIVVFSFYMLGLFVAGLALFYKRVGSITQILNYMLLFFANITALISKLPSFIQPIFYFIPVSWAMELIRSIIINSSVSSVEHSTMFSFTALILCFIAIGVAEFTISLKRAKES